MTLDELTQEQREILEIMQQTLRGIMAGLARLGPDATEKFGQGLGAYMDGWPLDPMAKFLLEDLLGDFERMAAIHQRQR
jgi:hypothetical protein